MSTKQINRNLKRFKLKSAKSLTLKQLRNNVQLSGLTVYKGKKLNFKKKKTMKFWLKIWLSIKPKIDKILSSMKDVQKVIPRKKPVVPEMKFAMYESMPDEQFYSGTLRVRITYSVYDDGTKVTPYVTKIVDWSLEEIEEYVIDLWNDWVDNFEDESIIEDATIEVKLGRKKFGRINPLVDMVLKKVCFSKLPIPISANNAIYKDHCVKDYLVANAKKLRLITKMPMIKKMDDWTVKTLISLFKKSSRNFEIYDQLGDSIWIQKKRASGPYFRFIVANDHLFPITKSELKLTQNYQYNAIEANDVQLTKHLDASDIKKLIQTESVSVTGLNLFDGVLTKFVCNDILYTDELTKKSYDLAKSIGIIDNLQLSDKFKLDTPLMLMLEKYGLYSTVNHTMTRPRPINIGVPSELDNILQIDLNKAYSSTASILPHFPVINATTVPIPYDNEPIQDTNFYNVTAINNLVTADFIVLGTNSGYILKYFASDVTISHYTEPNLKDNPYQHVIKEYLAKDPIVAKNVINRFIGSIQNTNKSSTIRQKNYRLFTSKNECELFDGEKTDYCKLDKNLYVGFEYYEADKRFSKNALPFAQYIVDRTKEIVYLKYLDLKKKNLLDELISIKTDSISYIGKPCPGLNFKPGQWKPEVYGSRKHQVGATDIPYYSFDGELEMLQEVDKELVTKNLLIDNYAGRGKSYFIINTVIPLLEEMDRSYVIVCAQHNPLIEYSGNDYPVKTITKLLIDLNNGKKMPDTLIIDEAGMTQFSQWERLWLYASKTKNIIALGDRNQTCPVDPGNPVKINPLNNINIRQMFDYQVDLPTNHRNSYTDQEYNEMYKNEYEPSDHELDRHNIISEFNICFTNRMRHNINDMCINDWEDYLDIGDTKLYVQEGGKLICRSNRLKRKQLVNNMILTIVSYNLNKNTLIVNNGFKDMLLTESDIELAEIEYGYAMTIYCAQSRTIPYEKISFWEMNKIKRIPGGVYTAYSRMQF